jgi:hypothetical protein
MQCKPPSPGSSTTGTPALPKHCHSHCKDTHPASTHIGQATARHLLDTYIHTRSWHTCGQGTGQALLRHPLPAGLQQDAHTCQEPRLWTHTATARHRWALPRHAAQEHALSPGHTYRRGTATTLLDAPSHTARHKPGTALAHMPPGRHNITRHCQDTRVQCWTPGHPGCWRHLHRGPSPRHSLSTCMPPAQ